MPKTKALKLRALTDLSLRQSANPREAAYQEWYEWKAGEEFEPPPHLDIERALARGIIGYVEEVSDDG